MKAVVLSKAKLEDSQTIMFTQMSAFLDDNKNKPTGASKVLPPGCNSLKWNSDRILNEQVYKIEVNGIILGGFIIFDYGTCKKEIGRVWVVPEYQNMGIGKSAFEELFNLHNEIKEWYIESPDWAKRNHYLYEKMGFKKIGESCYNQICGWKEYKYKKTAD